MFHRLWVIMLWSCMQCVALVTCQTVRCEDAIQNPGLRGTDSIQVGEMQRTQKWSNPVSGPVCGLYAVSSAIKRLGGDVSPRSLLTTEFVGTCEGTTQGQLVAAIESSHFRAFPATGLCILDVSIVQQPFIALVRPSASNERYSHWVCVHRVGADIIMLDSGKQAYKLTPAEFMALWSGSGVFVRDQNTSSPLVEILLLRAFFMQMILGVGFIGLVAIERLGRSMLKELFVIGIASLVFCLIQMYSIADAGNFWAGTRLATAPHVHDLKSLPIAEAVSLSRRNGTFLIDARREVDFDADRISGAVNVPFYASQEDVKTFFAKTDMSIPIYVYCQSDLCDYDEIVGRSLKSLGFTNVSVCEGGIVEYRQVRAK